MFDPERPQSESGGFHPMSRNRSDRRRFLNRSLTGSAAAGMAVLALPATVSPAKAKPGKKVINRPGQKNTPETILSPGIQYGNLLFISGAGAHDPITHAVVPGPLG